MSNYIQIELGGKLRGLKFNQGTLIEFNTIVELNNLDATSGYALIWSALKSNAFVKREQLTYKVHREIDGKMTWIDEPVTFEVVCDWVDELDVEVIKSVLSAFEESKVYQKLLKVDNSEEKKNTVMQQHTEPIVSD